MTLAIDIGATNIRVADVSGKIVRNKQQSPTPKTKKKIIRTLFSLIDQHKNRKVICIGLAGFIKSERILGTPNMDLNNVDLKRLLERKYKARVYLENDAKCAGLAELYYGNGRRFRNFILLTLGTGIGGAAIINKKLYRGSGVAGEFGHMILQDKDIDLEHLSSGPASLELAKKLGFKKISSLALEDLAKHHNKRALEVYKEVGEKLGIGLLNLSYAFDPDAIILAGGFSRVKLIHKEATRVFRSRDKIKRKIPVIFAKLGQDAGLVGAALLPKFAKEIKQ